jgi:hypothetical protein
MSIHETDVGVDSERVSVEHDDDVLFSREAELRFASQWADIQSRFVDDPRAAVACADDLVNEVMDRIGDWFAERRSTLGHQWRADDPADTEELRQAMQRYRDLFHRLLSI